MKNIGPFLAFNELWFAKNQRWLLWLLNAPVLQAWFRWVLRIRKEDCPIGVKITELGPNRFSYGDRLFFDKRRNEWRIERTTDFRTHPKFGKRLYHAFKPVWWMIHFWDWAVADRVVPALSYGFATLTAYPDPDPETSTVDGYVGRSVASATLSSIRSGAGNIANDAASLILEIDSSSTSNQFALLQRAIALFDTSSLGSGATISAATLSLYGTGKTNGLGSPDLHVAGSTPASNTALVNADYGQCQTTSFGSVTYASYSTAGYNDITLNASGIANISKTGISKFSAQLSWDINNSFTGSWSSENFSYFIAKSADTTAGTTNDPKLVVTYTASASYTQTLTESTTISDVLRKTPARALVETATMTASAIKTAVRTLTESTTITDTLTKIRGQVKELLESFTASDSLLRSITRNLTESATISDSLPKGTERNLSESASMSDAVNKTPGKNLTESTSITDNLIRGISRLLLETATMTASLISGLMYGRTLTETITVADSLIRGIARTLTESLTITDTLKRYLNGLLAIFSDKFSRRNTSYSDKHSARGTSFNNKYSSRGTSYSDKYTHPQ